MNICIIGNESTSVRWDAELINKDIIVRIFPNLYNEIYNETFFQKEHHAILNGLYNSEETFDISADQREALKRFHKIKFMYINRDKDLIKLADNFGIDTFRHLARDQGFFQYISEMEERFKNKFSVEVKTLLYYCYTNRESNIYSYRFGFKSKKLTPEKKFINSLYLNHIAHD